MSKKNGTLLERMISANSSEERIKKAQQRLLDYAVYCDEEEQEPWKEEVEILVDNLKRNEGCSIREEYVLVSLLLAGEYMRMREEKQGWEEVKKDFFESGYPKDIKSQICSIMAEYSSHGVEFFDKVYGPRLSQDIRLYYLCAQEKEKDHKKGQSSAEAIKKRQERRARQDSYAEIVTNFGYEICSSCYDDGIEEWVEIVSNTLGDERSEDSLVETSTVIEIVTMLNEGKSYDDAKKYLGSKIISTSNLERIVFCLLEYFPKGNRFVISSYDEKELPKELRETYRIDKKQALDRQAALIEEAREAYGTIYTLCDSDKAEDYSLGVLDDLNDAADKARQSVLSEEDENKLNSYVAISYIADRMNYNQEWQSIKEALKELRLNKETTNLAWANMSEYFSNLIKGFFGDMIPDELKMFNPDGSGQKGEGIPKAKTMRTELPKKPKKTEE